jgi:ABC-type dipeptide/oligopeptide/nickel transport system ATPase component
MKKIDLHIHTISTISDHAFDFSLDKLIEYVESEKLEAIAITNHNLFNRQQYETIAASISIPVFPGIEVDVESGHLLVITEISDMDDFCDKCSRVFRINGSDNKSFLTEQDFIAIFGDLREYLLIPHHDKTPVLSQERIPTIRKYISCGEVSSVKKFISMKKTQDDLAPVLFSDIRISSDITMWPKRQTFIDVEEISISSIKYALCDSTKVSVSPEDGHTVFEVLDNGLCISTGLTVILGKRSSGKSFTLDRINEQFENAKYIEQFDLLSKDDAADQRQFEQALRTQGDSVAEAFLSSFKSVIEDVKGIDLHQDEQDVENYLKALMKAASEAERQDVFAKCSMFQESQFSIKDLKSLDALIAAVDTLLRNSEYRDIINRHLSRESLLKLAIDLREQYIREQEKTILMQYTNDIVISIQRELQVRSSNTPVPDVDFYQILLNREKIKKFIGIAKQVKKNRVIEQRNLYSYRVVAKAAPYEGAQALQRTSRLRMVFSDAFKKYDAEYEYLQMLKQKEELPASEYYKYFAQITYEVLNRYGTPASGGERSEYNLLQQLTDAARSEILLMDEPESSFDNLFLKDGVNTLLKELSKQIPVVIATHNNTIGASLHPDYLIYTEKEIREDGEVKYHLYYGYPSNTVLTDLEENKINRKDVMLDCLEAGEPAYMDRRHSYEILND